MDILERLEIVLEGGLDCWPTASMEWEYAEAIKEIKFLRDKIKNQKRKFIIVHDINEEYSKFVIDGEEIGSTNHDDHGWSGMSAMESLFKKIAEKCNYELEETEDD